MQIVMFFLRLTEWGLKLCVQLLLSILGTFGRGLTRLVADRYAERRQVQPQPRTARQRAAASTQVRHRRRSRR